MRKIITATIGLLLVGGGAIGWELYQSDEPRVAASASPPIPVVMTKVTQQDLPIILTGPGTVEALNSATIHSQVTGLLKSANFVEGQFVKRGDILAQIDPRIYQARLDQASAQLSHDQAQLTNARTNLARNEPLLQRGFATEQLVTDEKAQIDELQSTIKSDQATIDVARTEVDYTTLRAPFDGVTGIRLIDIGNVIQPTDPTGILVLTQMQPISVIFTLPSSNIAEVQAALARGPVSVSVYSQDGNTKLDDGNLVLVNNRADPNSGTVQLKANFPNAQRQLWPGTLVNAQVTVSIVKDALTIPSNALQQSDKDQFVFVVDPDETVEPRTVTVAQRMRGTALITKGLRAGETVVTQGQYRLVPGAHVAASRPEEVADNSTASAGLLP